MIHLNADAELHNINCQLKQPLSELAELAKDPNVPIGVRSRLGVIYSKLILIKTTELYYLNQL